MIRVLVIAAVLTLVCSWALSAALPPITVHCQVRSAFAPADMPIEVYLSRSARNRLLVVRWESETGTAGSSAQPINGDVAPAVYSWTLKGLAAGDYDLTAKVYDAAGKVRASARTDFRVIGRE